MLVGLRRIYDTAHLVYFGEEVVGGSNTAVCGSCRYRGTAVELPRNGDWVCVRCVSPRSYGRGHGGFARLAGSPSCRGLVSHGYRFVIADPLVASLPWEIDCPAYTTLSLVRAGLAVGPVVEVAEVAVGVEFQQVWSCSRKRCRRRVICRSATHSSVTVLPDGWVRIIIERPADVSGVRGMVDTETDVLCDTCAKSFTAWQEGKK